MKIKKHRIIKDNLALNLKPLFVCRCGFKTQIYKKIKQHIERKNNVLKKEQNNRKLLPK